MKKRHIEVYLLIKKANFVSNEIENEK